MAKKKIWSGFAPLSILVALVAGILLLGRIGSAIDNAVVENGTKTIGTILDDGSNRITRIEYEVNGLSYVTGTGRPFSFIHAGEQFEMKYSQEDPKSIVVFFDRPHIANEQEYSETECTSVDKTLSVVRFEYIVGGQTIKRETLYRNHELSPNVYKVLYRTNDPGIGYLIAR